MTQIIYKKKHRSPEHTLQTQIVEYLRWKNVLVAAVENGGSRNFLEAVNLKKRGVLPGHPDLNVYLPNGKTVFLELKAGKNKQSKYQIDFEKKVKELGFEYYVIRGLEEIQKILGI